MYIHFVWRTQSRWLIDYMGKQRSFWKIMSLLPWPKWSQVENRVCLLITIVPGKNSPSKYIRGLTKFWDHSGVWPKVSMAFEDFKFKKSIFQTFWKVHCCPDFLFFEIETSNFGYLLIFLFCLTVQSFRKIGQHLY